MNQIDIKEIKLARQCLKFKGFSCDNEECINILCPLNKFWKEKND
jgi:hypothetical protein